MELNLLNLTGIDLKLFRPDDLEGMKIDKFSRAYADFVRFGCEPYIIEKSEYTFRVYTDMATDGPPHGGDERSLIHKREVLRIQGYPPIEECEKYDGIIISAITHTILARLGLSMGGCENWFVPSCIVINRHSGETMGSLGLERIAPIS